MRIIKMIIMISISGLFGCTTPHFSKLPEDGATMSDIYHKKTQSPLRDEHKLLQDALRSAAYQAEKQSTNDSEFVKLPNPEISMYIYPHFVLDEQLPVAGYTTYFPLFSQAHYVLAREIA